MWRCGECEVINIFDDDGVFNGFLVLKVVDYVEDMVCKKCNVLFSEENWVISLFSIYFGMWNGRKVVEGGLWYWNLEWYWDRVGKDYKKEDCYGLRKNGRWRWENLCIKKDFIVEVLKENEVVLVFVVVLLELE